MQKSDTDSSKVDSASLIDLKAELFRKQEEFKTQKLQSQNTGFIRGKPSTSNKKPSLFSKKNAGVTQRAERDYEEKIEEENVFERSRKALENKAKLYEKIACSTDISEEDGSGLYLVDFQKKSLDDFEERQKERKEKEEMERRELEEEQRQLAEPVAPPESEEEEWVDYVDAFGRSRRCLRKDLPDLQRQDERLQQKKRKIDEKVQKGLRDFQELRDKSVDIPNLMSADMKREMDRQKWEKEEIEKMEEEKQGPIHYADVQHNEIRTHGVGFYKFDKEESVRQEQMEQLHKLRQETKDERSKSERIKEKRKAALAARLAKVKQRKREKLGLPEPEEEENGSSDEEIGPKIAEEKKEPEPLTRDDSWRASVQSTRDWDKGKHLTMERSEQAWLEKQRAEREEEFAPPSFYYDTPSARCNTKKGNSMNQNKTKSQRSSGNIKQESDMASVVEKQLSEIRKIADLEASGIPNANVILEKDKNSSFVCEGESDKYTVSSDSTNTENLLPKFSSSSDNIPSQPSVLSVSNTNLSLPHFGNQSSNYQTPPSSFSVPPLNLNVPPPNLNAPPPNYGIPPPTYAPNYPPPSFPGINPAQVPSVTNIPYNSVQMNTVPLVETKSSVASENVHTYQAGQFTAERTEEKGRTKFVPKLDIIDTRLMDSEND